LQGRIEDIVATGERRLVVSPPVARRAVRTQYRHLYRLVAVTDVVSIAAALIVSYWIRFGFSAPDEDFVWLLLGTPFVVLAAYAMFHLYEAYRFNPAEEFRRIMLAVSLGLTGLVALSFWSQAEFSRLWLALSWGLALVFALSSRRIWHALVGRARAEGRLSFPTLVVGTNDEAAHLLEVMERPSFGFSPMALVSTSRHTGPLAGDGDEPPVVGSVADLRDLIRETGAECVFVASSSVTHEEMNQVAKAVRLEGVEVRVTATLPDVLSSRLSVQPFGGMTALSLRPVQLTGTQVVAKRAFDLVLAGVGLVLISPLLFVIAAAIKLTSPGPVFYSQRRVGQRGRPFTILKFRTMRVGADEEVERLREQHGVTDLMFKMTDDPRITKVGKLLRKFSLDELPQLINVVRGEMSLVGPRPPLPEEVTQYKDWQFDRLEVPPGITGLWQVSGRSELSFDDCVRLDLFYIENWSLAYDLYILAKTVPVLLAHRGAY
jgi:exopolysaccharide biosynthesis polyprenyl glycosylphosphotransferase